MRFKKEDLDHEGEFKLDITPLIDVVFLLLIFLLISTTFKTAEFAFEIKMPEAGKQTKKVKVKNNTIYLSRAGKLYFLHVENGETPSLIQKPLSKEELLKKLKQLVRKDKNIEIFIKADKEVKFQKIVDLLDLCVKAGVINYYFPYRLKDELQKNQ